MFASVNDKLLRLGCRYHADSRMRLTVQAILVLALFVFQIQPAMAATDGAALWEQAKAVFFGPWGLIGGVVILACSVFSFLRFGIATGVGVVVVGIFVFLIPSLVIMFQSFGKSQAGG